MASCIDFTTDEVQKALFNLFQVNSSKNVNVDINVIKSILDKTKDADSNKSGMANQKGLLSTACIPNSELNQQCSKITGLRKNDFI